MRRNTQLDQLDSAPVSFDEYSLFSLWSCGSIEARHNAGEDFGPK